MRRSETLAAWLVYHPRLRVAVGAMTGVYVLCLWAVVAAPRASAAVGSAALGWTGLHDSDGVPLADYFLSVVDTTEATLNNGQGVGWNPTSWAAWVIKATNAAITHGTVAWWLTNEAALIVFGLGIAFWLLKFAMSSSWLLASGADRPPCLRGGPLAGQRDVVGAVGDRSVCDHGGPLLPQRSTCAGSESFGHRRGADCVGVDGISQPDRRYGQRSRAVGDGPSHRLSDCPGCPAGIVRPGWISGRAARRAHRAADLGYRAARPSASELRHGGRRHRQLPARLEPSHPRRTRNRGRARARDGDLRGTSSVGARTATGRQRLRSGFGIPVLPPSGLGCSSGMWGSARCWSGPRPPTTALWWFRRP